MKNKILSLLLAPDAKYVFGSMAAALFLLNPVLANASEVLLTKVAVNSCPSGIFSGQNPCFGNAGNDSKVSATRAVQEACDNLGGQPTRIACETVSFYGVDGVSYLYGSSCATLCKIE